MTYHWTDPDGDSLHIEPTHRHGQPAISLHNVRVDIEGASVAVHVPVDRIEELVAGLRDTARQAASQEQPDWHRSGGFDQHDDYRETTP